MVNQFGARFSIHWCATALLLVTPAVSHAAVLHVDDDAPPRGDGQTWSTAFRFLQDALEAAEIDLTVSEIRIAQGTYQPDRSEADPGGSGSAMATFELRSDLALRGGFAGVGASDPDEVDLIRFISELTGDLGGDDPGGLEFAGVNSCTVIDGFTAPFSALVQGLHITRGRMLCVTRGNLGAGGISWCHATVRQCTFMNNYSKHSGGAASAYPDAVFDQCLFVENEALWSGGALASTDLSDPLTVTRCVFRSNQCHAALDTSPGGGAVRIGDDSQVTDCVFQNNTCDKNGGALVVRANSLVSHCTFLDNSAVLNGGGLGYYTQTQVLHCIFEGNAAGQRGGAMFGNPFAASVSHSRFLGNSAQIGGAFCTTSPGDHTFTNSIFAGNNADHGGALALAFGTLKLQNCTLYANMARVAGGGLTGTIPGLASASQVLVVNSILWGNKDAGGIPLHAQLLTPFATPTIYSCIQGLGDEASALGSLDVDPQLIDPAGLDGTLGTADDDLRLAANSPCIDAAANVLVPEGVKTDAGGDPRFADDPLTPDAGLGEPPVVDMGAYEFQPPAPGDVDDDGDVDQVDLALLLGQWGPCESRKRGECPADFNGDGVVNGFDLAMLLAAWNPSD